MSEKTPGLPVGPALVLFGIVGVLLVALLANQPRIPPAPPPTPTEIPTEVAVLPTATQVQAVAANDAEIRQGQTFFTGTCAACHGFDARGIPGLGKNLVESTFVHGLTDDELLTFIINGRPFNDPLNTTGVAMPPRGGNPSFTDDQLKTIIAYIRSLQAAQEAPAAPTQAPGVQATSKPFELPINSLNLSTATPTAPFVLPITGLNLSTPVPTTTAFDPAGAYAAVCSTCHGANGEGASASAAADWTMSDEDIFALLTTVHPAGNPEIQHVVYGGYLNLNADQLHELIDYLRTLPTS